MERYIQLLGLIGFDQVKGIDFHTKQENSGDVYNARLRQVPPVIAAGYDGTY